MIRWNQAPLVRLIIPFIAGILTAVFFSVQFSNHIYFICAILLFFSILLLLLKLNLSYRKSKWLGFLFNITLYLLAYQLTILKTGNLQSDSFSKFSDSGDIVYVRLSEPYLEKQKSLFGFFYNFSNCFYRMSSFHIM